MSIIARHRITARLRFRMNLKSNVWAVRAEGER
jgi:hypothetical protein